MRRLLSALLLLAGCAAPAPAPATLSGTVRGPEGLLPNVFVYVKRGIEGVHFPVPSEPVVLDQRGFEFVPRVFGIRAGQPLRIVSSDATLHNVNCQPFANKGFNESLFPDQETTKAFDKTEVMVLFKCDIHPQMRAYAGVLDHPFHAVTGFDGLFEIRGLPPGVYTIEAWDELKGARSKDVRLGPGAAPVEFRY